MDAITLTVGLRPPAGKKGHARSLRRAGEIPAVFYGRGVAALSLTVKESEFQTRLGRVEGTQLIRLSSTAGELNDKTVILKDVQVHPVTSEVLHADFYAIDADRSLRVHVPLHLTGKAAGVTVGGILQPIRRDITVECLPHAIPSAIEVDVSTLGIHDTIHVEELSLPEGVTVVADTNFAVVTVLPPTVEAAPAAEVAEAVAEGEEAAAPAAAEAPEGRSGEKEKESG